MSARRRAFVALTTASAIICLTAGAAHAGGAGLRPAGPEDPCPPITSSGDCAGVDVSGQSYNDAVLDHAILTGANMTDANFNGAVLWGADLTGADASRADLANASLIEATLELATFKSAKLNGADLTKADAAGTDFSNAAMREADLEHLAAPGASFVGVNATDSDLVHANLFQADFTGANLTEADFTGADLRVANLTGVNLTGADLAGTDLTGANLTNADLTGAKLTFAVLRGTVWSNTTCPDGRVVTGTSCNGGIATSDSGFITVPTFDSRIQTAVGGHTLTSVPANLWYSYFAADANAANAPLFVMQNGGPGAATMANLFANNTAPYTLNLNAIADAIANAGDSEPLIPFDPGEPMLDDDGNPTGPVDPNSMLGDTTPAAPTYVANPNSWTAMGNLLYIDPALTGFSYNISPEGADPQTPSKSFSTRLAQMAEGDNLNPWVDADQVLRAVLTFLDKHPTLADNPVIFVGESYGGVRVTTMLNMLLNSERYNAPSRSWPYSDPDLVSLIKAHFLGAGATGPVPKERVVKQFGRQILIQPQLSSYQGEVQGQMYYAPNSVIDQIAEEADGRKFDRNPAKCPKYMTAKNVCVTRYWVPQVFDKDQYAYDRSASYTDDQELYTLTQLNNLGTLNVLLGANVAKIDGFTPADRVGKAYHSLGEGIEALQTDGGRASVGPDTYATMKDDPDALLADLQAAGAGNGPLARILRLIGIDPDVLRLSRMTGKGTLNNELGELYEADEYVIAFNMAEWAFYTQVSPITLPGAQVDADSDPIFGDMFVENAKSVRTFLTDAKYDLVIYSDAIPVALAKHKGVSTVVAKSGDTSTAAGLGTFTITYDDQTKVELYYPYYDKAGHAVAAGQPDKLRADITTWLTK